MQGPDIAIVRAIASLVFGKAWEGFTLESMDNYKFKVDYLHQLVYLFGCPLGLEWGLKQFKGLDKFSPSEELRDRVVRFWNLHQTIGNIILLPTMLTQNLVEINLTRAKRLWRNYPDSFLKELREELRMKPIATNIFNRNATRIERFMPVVKRKKGSTG